MNKKQKTWFGIAVVFVILLGIVVSVVLVSSGKDKENEPIADIETSEQESSIVVGDEIMEVQPNESETEAPQESQEEEEEEVDIDKIKEEEFKAEYIEQEDVERQEMSEEDLKVRDDMAKEYAAEHSSTDVQPPFDSMLNRIKQDYDKISWEEVYLTKGNFIWWLENEAKTKVETSYNVNILPHKGLINIYVDGNEEQTEKVEETLEKWVVSMLYSSAYNEMGTEFKVSFYAEQ